MDLFGLQCLTQGSRGVTGPYRTPFSEPPSPFYSTTGHTTEDQHKIYIYIYLKKEKEKEPRKAPNLWISSTEKTLFKIKIDF